LPEALPIHEKLALSDNQEWQTLCLEILQNYGQGSRKPCAVLDQFHVLLNGLDTIKPDTQAMIEIVINLAKYNNKFGLMDKYMKHFAKVLINGGQETELVARNLEILLNTEIAIRRPVVDQEE